VARAGGDGRRQDRSASKPAGNSFELVEDRQVGPDVVPKANKPDGYLLGSYRMATAPEPNSSRLTSFKSIRFDSPANC
jgi:hypothetical protein